MSLQNININNIKRLSLQGIQLTPIQVKHEEPQRPKMAEESKFNKIEDNDQLVDLAQKILDVQNNYTKEDIITKIKDEAKVSQELAENIFNLFLTVGAIDSSCSGRYYLTDSTPF